MANVYVGGSGVPPTISEKSGAMSGGFSKEALANLRANDRAVRRGMQRRASRRGYAK